jgi:hypothetical protein
MRVTALLLIFLPVSLSANPVMEYFFSEFSTDPGSTWLELYHHPEFSGPRDLTGWTLITRTSACTLGCVLDDHEYLILDSAALAAGTVGSGTLRFDPDCDTLFLQSPDGQQYEWLTYPASWMAPAPGPGTSASLYYREDWEGPFTNWYVDSTPTPAAANDDYSSAQGLVRGEHGEVFSLATIHFRGPSGGCGANAMYDTAYTVAGLGPGRYQVSFSGWFQSHYYRHELPESVDIGYSTLVTGVDIIVPMTGVSERRPVSLPAPSIRQQGRDLLVTGSGSADLAIYDLSGRLAFSLPVCRLPSTVSLPLRPGIYFCRLAGIAPAKLVIR